MAAERSAGWLYAGRIGRPHGLDGSFHVTNASPALLAAATHVALGTADAARTDAGLRRIERRAGHEAHMILRLEGCADRAAAEALRGAELLVTRNLAPPLGEDEWWAEELEGCRVHDRGRAVGIVSRLLALPSCEVLEVVRDGAASDDRPLLVPLVGDAVRSVDAERREIDVDLEFLGEE